jgi:hypothetical protein
MKGRFSKLGQLFLPKRYDAGMIAATDEWSTMKSQCSKSRGLAKVISQEIGSEQ